MKWFDVQIITRPLFGNAVYGVVFTLLFTWVLGLIEYSVDGLAFMLLEIALLVVLIRVHNAHKRAAPVPIQEDRYQHVPSLQRTPELPAKSV